MSLPSSVETTGTAAAQMLGDASLASSVGTAGSGRAHYLTVAELSALVGLSAAVHEGPSIGTPVNIGTAARSPTAETITITVGASGVPAGQTIFVAVSTRGGNTTTGLASVEDSVNGAYEQDLLGMNASGGTKGGLFRFTDNAALVEDDTITVTLLDGITNVQAATAF